MPVYAPSDGTVRHNKSRTGFGRVVVIEHTLSTGQTVCSVLGHLRAEGIVDVGVEVSAGQLIGYLSDDYSENGGYSFTHLHYGIKSGAYNFWSYPGYAAGTDGWYDPSDFTDDENTHPQIHSASFSPTAIEVGDAPIVKVCASDPYDFIYVFLVAQREDGSSHFDLEIGWDSQIDEHTHCYSGPFHLDAPGVWQWKVYATDSIGQITRWPTNGDWASQNIYVSANNEPPVIHDSPAFNQYELYVGDNAEIVVEASDPGDYIELFLLVNDGINTTSFPIDHDTHVEGDRHLYRTSVKFDEPGTYQWRVMAEDSGEARTYWPSFGWSDQSINVSADASVEIESISILDENGEEYPWEHLFRSGDSFVIRAIAKSIGQSLPSVDVKLSSSLTRPAPDGVTISLDLESANGTQAIYSQSFTITSELIDTTRGEADDMDEWAFVELDRDIFDTTNTYLADYTEIVDGKSYGSTFLKELSNVTKVSLASANGSETMNIPPASYEYFKAGGFEKVTVTGVGIDKNASKTIFVKNQADWLIFTSHGSHETGGVKVRVKQADGEYEDGKYIGEIGSIAEVGKEWGEDLDGVFFSIALFWISGITMIITTINPFLV